MIVDNHTHPQSIGHFLKTETEYLHRDVEGKLAKILFQRNLNATNYMQILHCMHNAYSNMESALVSHAPANELLVSRSKLHWLEKDIACIKSSHNCDMTLNDSTMEVNLSSPAHAMGLLYVMEGATLGGEHIYARLKKHAWLDSQHGVSFFLSYGSARVKQWRAFSLALQSYYEQNSGSHNKIKEGAELAFNCIGKSLQGINQ